MIHTLAARIKHKSLNTSLSLADNWNNLDQNEVENDVIMEEYGGNGYYANQNVAMVFNPGEQHPPVEQPKR